MVSHAGGSTLVFPASGLLQPEPNESGVYRRLVISKEEMSLVIPNLAETQSTGLSACGQLLDRDPIRQEEPLVAKLGRKPASSFLRFIGARKPKSKHFHWEVATVANFPSKLPIANATRSKLDKIATRFYGSQVAVKVRGAFMIPVETLPANGVIRTLCAGSTVGGVSLKLTAGRLELTGSRIHLIDWHSQEINGIPNFLITVCAERKIEFTPEYLTTLQSWIRRQFEITVLGDE